MDIRTVGALSQEQARRGQVDTWGEKAVGLIDKAGERGYEWCNPKTGIDYYFLDSIKQRHDEIASAHGTDPQGSNIKVNWTQYGRDGKPGVSALTLWNVEEAKTQFARASTDIGTLPPTINYSPLDVARLHTVLVPKIARFAISTSAYFWNPITTASVAIGIGSTEAPTLTTQDDTYTKATLVARGTSGVGVVTDLAQAVAGRPIQNEIIAAKLRALDVYEELTAYTGTGGGSTEPYKGIEALATTNALTASSLLTLDQLDTERAKIGKINPNGFTCDLGLTDYSTWNTLAKQVNVQLRTSTPGRATSSRAEVGLEYPNGTTVVATPHMSAASASRVFYFVDTKVLAFADVMYRAIGQYARTTYQDTTGIQSWTAGIVDFSANAAGGTGGLAHDVISGIT